MTSRPRDGCTSEGMLCPPARVDGGGGHALGVIQEVDSGQTEEDLEIRPRKTARSRSVVVVKLDTVAEDGNQVSEEDKGLMRQVNCLAIDNVKEDNLRRLHEIHDGIQRLRQINNTQDPANLEDGRKDSLQRFSTSCPSLADKIFTPLSLVTNDERSEHFKSMLELTDEKSGQCGPLPPDGKTDSRLYLDPQSALTQQTDVKICINDVTVDSTDDFSGQERTENDDEDVLSAIELKKQRRRSSWCPEEGRKKEEKQEKQRMLAVSGRSQSLSSLDGQDDDSDDSDDDANLSDASGSYSDTKEHVTSPSTSRGTLVTSVASEANVRTSSCPTVNAAYTNPDYQDQKSPKVTSAPADYGKKIAFPSSPRHVSEVSISEKTPMKPDRPARSLGDIRLDLTASSSRTEVPDGGRLMCTYGGNVQDGGGSPGATSLNVPSSPLLKSISSPSLPSIKDDVKRKAEDLRSGIISESAQETAIDTPPHQSHLLIQKLVEEHDAQVARLEEEEEDEDELLNSFLQQERTSRARMSMIEFLNDPSNFEEDEVDRPKRENKEEKKRRPSVFSKFGSYRQRNKLAKDSKSKNTHQFVSVSFSNSTACDVCNKSMAGKAALQCENCMVNVHENSCKDQIAQCTRFKHPKLQHRESMKEKMAKYQSSSLPGGNSGVKVSNSFKHDRTRATSVPARPAQLSHSLMSVPRHTSPGVNGSTVGSSGYFQWRRVATKLGIDKVINEEREKGGKKDEGKDEKRDQLQPDSSPHMQLQISDGTNITDTMSVSMESLDEGAGEIGDFEDDPDLMNVPEAEAWSVTVDKKTLKKMSAKDIKRQDHIWELIQTEKHFCRTLKIMSKIFSRGMQTEVHMSQDMIDRIFPQLDELIDIHVTFLHSLTERQRCRVDRHIEDISDLLVQQFEGEMGDRMRFAYGEFCSRHNEAVQLHKDILKNDRKYQNFIKKCSRNIHTKKLGITECILYVTQRMTKYPLLIEPIIKTTKETKPEYSRLKRALDLTREILSYIDDQVDARAKEQRLIEIYNKLDARSYAIYKGTKFKKSDLLSNNRKLLSEGTIRWMSARGKAFEVLAVILSDVMFFLQENNQKYTFFSQDNKSSVVSLAKLLVREKGDTKDSKGIYLICQSKTEPEMYELVCRSADERKSRIETIRSAITKCPEEDEGLPSESEEERKLQAARSARLRQLIGQLHDKDNQIKASCDEKLKTMLDMRELFTKEDFGENASELHTGNSAFYTTEEPLQKLRSVYKDEEGQELMDPEDLLQAALREASRLYILLQSGGTNLSRSASSVGEHESGTYTTPPLPKRAETFSGFEAREKDKNVAATKRAETFAGFEAKERDQFKPVKKRYSSGGKDNDGSTGSLIEGNVIVLPGQQRDSGDIEHLLSAESANTSRSLSSRRGSCGSPAAHEATRQSNKERGSMSRRMSTSFLQNLLIKQHNEKDETESQKSGGSSDRGSVGSSIGELLSSSTPGGATLQLIPPNKEQIDCLIQLVHYLQALVTVTIQQSTEVESFRMQYIQANKEVSRLHSETERITRERKHAYHHDKQLEELRNLQESINAEKAHWEKIKEKERESIGKHQDHMDSKEKELQHQRDEIKAQREKLQREREALQRQMDFFEQLKAQTALSHQQEPYSPNSSADSPSLQRTSSNLDSPSIRPVPPSSVPQTLWDNVAHKRSSSEDLQRSSHGEPYEPMKQEYSNSLKEPLHSNRDSRETNRETHRDSRSRSDSRTRLHPSPSQSAGNSPGSGPNSGKQRDVVLPIHLISATNEQKIGQVAQQQLPLKLVAQLGSSKSSSSLQSSNSSGKLAHKSPGSGEQTVPLPQSGPSYASPGSGPVMAGATSPHNVIGHHHPHHHQPLQQTPVTYTTGPGGNSVAMPPTKHVMMPPNMNIVNPGGHSTHHTDQHASGVSTSGRGHGPLISGGRQQPSQTMSSMLPMKLASQKGRQKSSSSSSLSNPAQRHPQQQLQQQGAVGNPIQQETPKSSKHSQKSSRKEQEIIYF